MRHNTRVKCDLGGCGCAWIEMDEGLALVTRKRHDIHMSGPWVEVDLGMLESNIRQVQASLRAGVSLYFVVKADAYGHGLVPVAARAWKAGASGFAVAYVREAMTLRDHLGDEPSLILIGAADPEDVPQLIARRITPLIISLDHARALGAAAALQGRRLAAHLKVDTGMGRLGFPWHEVEGLIPDLLNVSGLEISGICTHFAAIDPLRPEQAIVQHERFCAIRRVLESALQRKVMAHCSSSLPFLFKPEWDFDAVRTGILLYGYETGHGLERVRTTPILQWKTRVLQCKTVPAGTTVGYGGAFITSRTTDIATISAGYADGYPRALSNKGCVLIRGRRCPVAGRVSMNWISVDAGVSSGIHAGDEVVLIGRQGVESLWADELAALSGTISYEILTGIHPSAERQYVDG